MKIQMMSTIHETRLEQNTNTLYGDQTVYTKSNRHHVTRTHLGPAGVNA
jgi:hypothetical protein